MFVGGQVSDDILHRPYTADASCVPGRFGQTLHGPQHSTMPIFQYVRCIHRYFLSAESTSASFCGCQAYILLFPMKRCNSLFKFGCPAHCFSCPSSSLV